MQDPEQEEQQRVRVRFTTKYEELRVTDTSIAVPVDLGRRGLSEVVNHLLDLPQGAVPLDFVHVPTSKALRSTLVRFIRSHDLSLEDVVELEYQPALQEPQVSCEQQEPDWIAAIDARGSTGDARKALGVVGSFDGALEVFSLSKDGKLETMSRVTGAHQAAIKSVASCVPPESAGFAATDVFVSASKDGTIGVWQLEDGSLGKVGQCIGHSNCIEAVAARALNKNSYMVASGGWDKNVCLWEISKKNDGGDASEGSDAKRRRGANQSTNVSATEYTPLGVFAGHSDNVSCVEWASTDTVLSGAWDNTLRAWNVEQQMCTRTWTGNKVVTSLCVSPDGQRIVSGHPDHCIRMWDARAGGDSAVQSKFASHSAWVTAVAWNPAREELVLSAAADKTVCVWDIRSSVPLYTMSTHTGKVFAVDWAPQGLDFVSGGADCRLVAHSIESPEL